MFRLKKKKNRRELLVAFVSRTLLVFWVGGCASVLADADHIPKYIFHLTDNGRLLHDPISFFFIALCLCWITISLMARWSIDLRN